MRLPRAKYVEGSLAWQIDDLIAKAKGNLQNALKDIRVYNNREDFLAQLKAAEERIQQARRLLRTTF